MKKQIFKVLGVLTVLLVVGFISFKIGYNEGSYKTATKYNMMAEGMTDQFGRDVYLTDNAAIAKNVSNASSDEANERWGRRMVYTGAFLIAKN